MISLWCFVKLVKVEVKPAKIQVNWRNVPIYFGKISIDSILIVTEKLNLSVVAPAGSEQMTPKQIE